MSARTGFLALGLALLGCSGLFGKKNENLPICRSDSDCAPNEVCFIDGCGDPGQGIAVEVTPSSRNGAYPQDFPIDDLKASQTLELYSPSLVQGVLQRDQDSGGPVPYTGTVSIVLSGQSTVIPGLSRHFEATVGTTDGTYSLPVGSGLYALSATPDDPTLPPLFDFSRKITPGQSEVVDLLLPKPSALATIAGSVVQVIGSPVGAAMQVQAFDPSGQPLSQRIALDATGGFALSVLAVDLDTLEMPQIELRVTPVDPQATLPSKSFVVAPQAVLPAPLELGAFGAPFTVHGTLVADRNGTPIAGAAVHLEGTVIGDGTFHSQVVQTAADGSFSLQTLEGAATTGLTLFAVPQSLLDGILALPIPVTPQNPQLGAFRSPTKIGILGTVLTPDGAPAVGVQVTAVPLEPIDPRDPAHPLPAQDVENTTSSDGTFSLWLDPARYRLDFVPGQSLPRLSRFLDVAPGTQPPSLPPFTLSHGRTVTGHVAISSADGGTSDVASLARVRFYRRVDDGPTSTSELLDQAYADQNGNFTVLLPTH